MKKVDDTRKKIEIVEIESEPLQSSEVQSIVQSIVQSSELQSSTALQISTEIQEYKFAFYAQMFLSCQFCPENVEYTSQLPPLTSEIAQAISQDITKIKQTLESKIEISDRKPIEMKGHVWMILFDGVVCVLGCQRGKVQVECDNLDLGNRVTGVASRIVKTLLPISETWTLHSGLSR